MALLPVSGFASEDETMPGACQWRGVTVRAVGRQLGPAYCPWTGTPRAVSTAMQRAPLVCQGDGFYLAFMLVLVGF